MACEWTVEVIIEDNPSRMRDPGSYIELEVRTLSSQDLQFREGEFSLEQYGFWW